MIHLTPNTSLKRQEIEWLRILGAFGIVWFHCSSIGKDVAYAGLISFLIISLFLSAKPKPVLERMNRLLTPWVIWLLFYGFLNLARNLPFVNTDFGIISGVFAGSAIHLWYLPFIFFVVTFFDQIRKCLPTSFLAYLCAFIIMLLIISVSVWRHLPFQITPPLGQYMHALIGVFAGVFFASYSSLPKNVFIIILLIIFTLLCIFAWDFEGIGVPYLLGLAVTSFILLPSWSFDPKLNLNWLSSCTLGVYMVHPFFILLEYKLYLAPPLFTPFIVFTLSVIFVLCLKSAAPRLAKYIV